MSKVYPNNERLSNQIVSMVEEELNEYDPDNVDVVLNEETGELDIIYHSSNNSFLIKATHIKIEDVDLKVLEEGLDEHYVGHCW